jgi:hypothetical protein
MPRIDCQACGRALEVPPDFPGAADFACGHCGLWMRNVEAARSFRFASEDPYVRRHGASRLNLWGGTVGAALWLPIMAGVLAWRGMFDAGFLAAVGIPYVALLALLFRRRAGAAAGRFGAWTWMGLGVYALYLFALFALVPGYAALFAAASEAGGGPAAPTGFLGVFGATALAVGVFVDVHYRRRAARLPRFRAPVDGV